MEIRLGKRKNTQQWQFVNDVATALPVVLAEQGPAWDIAYHYGLGLVSESANPEGGNRSKPAQFFYHYDGLGSVVNMTQESGVAGASFDYDAWGDPTSAVNALANFNRLPEKRGIQTLDSITLGHGGMTRVWRCF